MRGGWVRRTTACRDALLVGVLLAPSVAGANVGRDGRAGDLAGEPRGAVAGVVVEHELLTLDLRPLAAGGPARIVASYRLRNDGASVDLELAFASPGVVAGSVTLDGVVLAATPLAEPVLPPPWRAPVELPGIDGGTVRFEADAAQVGALAFRAGLGPGAHVLTVACAVRPGEHHGRGSPYRDYLLAYLLAPARDWGAFGQLRATVELPAGWAQASSPPLTRLGDRLVGEFAGLPGDFLGVTVRPPGEAGWPTTAAPWAGALLGAVPAWLLGWWWGRRSARRGERTRKRWLKALGLAYLAAVAAAVATAAAAAGGSALLDEAHRSTGWGTAYLYESILAGAAGLCAGLLGFFVVFVWTHRAAVRDANAVLREARREEPT
jgi:hypothetical protein